MGLQLRDQFHEHGHVITGSERPDKEKPLNLGPLECEGKLLLAIGRVDVDQHSPYQGGGHLQKQPLDVVRRPDTDPVTATEPQTEQPLGQLVDGLGQFGIR